MAFNPCIFFDRDGIVNTAPPPEEYYVLSPDRFFIEEGFLSALRVVNELNYAAVIVTNQKGVHRGLITMAEIDAIHDVLWDRLAEEGLRLDAIYVSPYGDGHPERKPAPGMLLRAAKDHNLNLASSWMIGDSIRDVQAGNAAGCSATVFVNAETPSEKVDFHIPNMDALPNLLRQHLKPAF